MDRSYARIPRPELYAGEAKETKRVGPLRAFARLSRRHRGNDVQEKEVVEF